jgi:hypothetical protein
MPTLIDRSEVSRALGPGVKQQLAAVRMLFAWLITGRVCSPTGRLPCAGRRISEAVRLRPAAIDSERMVIRVEQGKGSRWWNATAKRAHFTLRT